MNPGHRGERTPSDGAPRAGGGPRAEAQGGRVARRQTARPGGRHGPTPRQAIAGWIVIVGVLAGGAVAFGGPPGPVAARQVTAVTAVTAATTALYTANCASCHGVAGEGTAVGPPLAGVGAAAADFYLRTGRMPLGAPGQRPISQEPAFSEQEIQALVAYVAALGPGPSIPTVTGGGDVGRGFELYTANCAACHGATGAGNAVGGGSEAVSLGQASGLDIAEAVTIGPGVMPPFALSDPDREAIIAYVEYLRSEPTPGGASIGGVGPVGEGFVAILVGLVGLIVIARFVGSRRWDEGDWRGCGRSRERRDRRPGAAAAAGRRRPGSGGRAMRRSRSRPAGAIEPAPGHAQEPERADPVLRDHGSRAERRAERTVLAAFAVSVLAGFSLLVVYARGGQTQIEGVLLMVCLGGIGLGIVVWGQRLMAADVKVEGRHPIGGGPEAAEELGEALGEEAGFTRRTLLIRALLGTMAGLAAALAVPVLSLGPAPGRSLFQTSWRSGARLAPPRGEAISIDALPIGGVLTVFPDGDATDPNAATLLIRVEPALLRLDPEHMAWAPDGFVAYSKVCTHAGCPVGLYRAAEHTLICPCHQSEFDVLAGAQPISGPAARPLPQLPISRDADGTFIALGDFTGPVGPSFWDVHA
jgi:ubiquinol-cytochrome c reductase iron-sulfur subunit